MDVARLANRARIKHARVAKRARIKRDRIERDRIKRDRNAAEAAAVPGDVFLPGPVWLLIEELASAGLGPNEIAARTGEPLDLITLICEGGSIVDYIIARCRLTGGR
jgi:hypothetical protein